MNHCPRCGVPLYPTPPQLGETWLRVDTGKLYVVTELPRKEVPWASAERLHPRGQQGCDPTWQCAMWPEAVRRGEWIRVDMTETTKGGPK